MGVCFVQGPPFAVSISVCKSMDMISLTRELMWKFD